MRNSPLSLYYGGDGLVLGFFYIGLVNHCFTITIYLKSYQGFVALAQPSYFLNLTKTTVIKLVFPKSVSFCHY